jgi:hypothetical protein
MSIYVAIACLGFDDELLRTVRSCIKTAENQQDLYFGVAIIGETKMYEDFIANFGDSPNIKVQLFPYEEKNIGVGIGRHLAMSFYNDQDYVMQIDSHSRMYKGWDTYLINKFEEAKELVHNQKVILTATPAQFSYNEFEPMKFTEVYNNQFMGYNSWLEREMLVSEHFIPWTHFVPHVVSPDLSSVIKVTGFAPAAKICAAFMFSNKHFAKNTHLDTNIIFWEEEPLQSIELLNDGFTLMYPGEHPVISHLYKIEITNNIGKRHNLFNIYEMMGKEYGEMTNTAIGNFEDYILNEENNEKISFFEKYNGISYKDHTFGPNDYPKKYANIGFLPL